MDPDTLRDLLADHDDHFAARRMAAMGVIHLARGAPYEWTPEGDARRADVHRHVAAHFTSRGLRPPPPPEQTRLELTRPPVHAESRAPAPPTPTPLTVAELGDERCGYVQAHADAKGLSFTAAFRDLEQRRDPRYLALTAAYRGAWWTEAVSL